MADDTTTEVWTYAGQRQSSSGGSLHAWKRPGEDDLAAFDSLTGSTVGATYEVQIITAKANGDKGSLVVRPPAVFHEEGNREDPEVRKWIFEDREARDSVALARAENAAKRRNEDLGQFRLEEFRERYWRTTAGQRNLMLARMISYIRQERAT